MNPRETSVASLRGRIGRIAFLYGVLAVLWFTLMAFFGPTGILGTRIIHAGYGIGAVLCVLNVVGFAVLLGATMMVRRARLPHVLKILGVRPWSWRAVAASLFAILAAVMLLYALGYRAQHRSATTVIPFDLLGPFVEEAIFRGFLFLQLRRWVQLPFWIAATLASVPFALEHTYQGVTTIALLEVLAVTFFGGIVLCWLVERWGTLWSAWVLHAGLNLLFSLFPLGANASDNVIGNIQRLLAIVCALLATWILTRRSNPRPGETTT